MKPKYQRYYFYLNEDGLLTCQFTNEPIADCVKKTFNCMNELALPRNHIMKHLEATDEA